MTGIDYDIRIEDLPESFQALAELVGMDAVLMIAAQFGGEKLHIYRIQTLMMAARDRAIVAEYKAGADYIDLARKYNLTSTRIRQIIADADVRRDTPERQKQLNLF